MSETWNNYINGEVVEPSTGRYLDVYSPSKGVVAGQVAASGPEDVDRALKAAKQAHRAWADEKPIARARILYKMAEYLRENAALFSEIEIREGGKAAWQAPLEVEVSAAYLEFYAGLCNLYQGEKIDIGPDYHCYTIRESFGVVGVITPWNSPLSQLCRGVAPALAAGNTVVAKPSEFTSGTALKLAQGAVEACGLPAGVFNVVMGEGEAVGAGVVEHPLTRKVAFTGSVATGRAIGKIAAERIIPVTLELGGKSPNIVFEDADLAMAVPGSLQAFALNAGQICFAGTRCIVHQSIYEKFVAGLKQAADSIKVGPEPDALIGAITTKAQYERVLSFFEIAKQDGANVVTGGELIKQPNWGDGWYLPLTIYRDVTNDMRIAREEIFGPVLCVIPFKDEEDAIAIANETDYGLASGIWTTSLSRAHKVAARIEAGSVFINEYSSPDVELPLGGYKNSGFGKEKGIEALHHYTQVKTVRIKL